MKTISKLFTISLVMLLASCNIGRSRKFELGKTVEGTPIKYSYKVSDKQKVLDCVDNTYNLAVAGTDYTAFSNSYDKLNEYFEQIMEARSYEELRYYMYGKEEYQTLYLDLYELLTTISNKATQIHYAVFENDFKSKFYEGMSDAEIIEAIGPKYSDEYYEKNNKAKELEAEFNNLDSSSDSFKKDASEIYIKYVKNANEMAILAGYSNFLDYSYRDYYDRPYAYQETDNFFKYVKDYAYPYFNKLNDDLTKEIQSLSKSDLAAVRNLVLNNAFTNNFNLIEEYKDYFGGEFKTIFDDAWFESCNYYISYEEDAMEAAFTSQTTNPFMFFGKRYEATTIVHEFGHYYDAVINDGGTNSFDLAETQSQGDEMLFVSFLKDQKKFSDPAADVIVGNQIYEQTISIIVASMVNEFEKKAYLDDDLTLSDINKYEAEVYSAIPVDGFDFGNYWRMVTISSPCYYISYATSGIGALEIYNEAKSNLREGINKYNKIISYSAEDADNYLKVYESAGLSSPFVEKTFQDIFK